MLSEGFEEVFRRAFMPLQYIEDMKKIVGRLTRTKPPAEYVVAFRSLVRLVGNGFGDTTLSNLFISGLKLQTRVSVVAARVFRLSGASDITVATGSEIEANSTKLSARPFHGRNTFGK